MAEAATDCPNAAAAAAPPRLQPRPLRFAETGSVFRLSASKSWIFFLLAACIAPGGCGKSSDQSTAPAPVKPYRAMKAAMQKGDWAEAWKASSAVLVNHPDDAEVIATVARVAHENELPEEAAELLVDACRAESFRRSPRVQQAMIALIGIGRLHEGMEMLEEAVAAQPLQHDTRRWLYDFYMGTENRKAGVVHGRYLVRQRQFDVDMLLTLSNTERRTHDSDPLQEMISRNPKDKRPQMGTAKSKFDSGDYEKAIETLQTIVQAHEDYLPAQSLLGRSLAAAARWEELESWTGSQSSSIEAYPGYWIALGDWARTKQENAAAARAYWEACRRDPDIMESWSKFNTTLQLVQSAGGDLPEEVLAGIENRVTLLSRFNQLKHRFERTGKISRATAVEMVETLGKIGRLWEAEAWASITLSLPEDDSVDAQQTRQSIVNRLSQDTPWQLTEQQPEFEFDFSFLELPTIGAASRKRTGSAPVKVAQAGDAGTFRLINEADRRGLKFFGRTFDQLEKPGIMLFRTLGCGGGTIDFDLDGWSDLYLVAAGGTPPKRDSEPNALFRNLGGAFADVTASAAVGDTGFGQGVAVGDVNEDGFPDLLVLNYGANTLLINNGDGTFVDASDRLGANPQDWSTSAAIADLDGDGFSDIAIVNYCAGFEPVTRPCPMKGTEVVRSCTPVKFEAAPDLFLQGTPAAGLVDQTEAWGAEPAVLGRGLGIVVGSLDDKPGVEVFVANDMTNNHYWSRPKSQPADSGKPFVLVDSAIVSGLGGDDRSQAQGSMGIATGDFDRDGDIDFYVTNFENEYNTYHDQSFPGVWQDRTAKLDLITPTLPLVGFGTEAVDLDNNGLVELIVSNGHVEIFSRDNERSVYAQPLQVFHRGAEGTFEPAAPSMASEYVTTPHVGRALWTLDANRDGLTDFAVTHQTQPVALLINQSQTDADWIAINLAGRSCSRDAVGATVEVACRQEHWMAIQTSGDGYLCSNERTLRFGLGDIGDATCEVKVTWPDGQSETFEGLTANETWLIVQSQQPFKQ